MLYAILYYLMMLISTWVILSLPCENEISVNSQRLRNNFWQKCASSYFCNNLDEIIWFGLISKLMRFVSGLKNIVSMRFMIVSKLLGNECLKRALCFYQIFLTKHCCKKTQSSWLWISSQLLPLRIGALPMHWLLLFSRL